MSEQYSDLVSQLQSKLDQITELEDSLASKEQDTQTLIAKNIELEQRCVLALAVTKESEIL